MADWICSIITSDREIGRWGDREIGTWGDTEKKIEFDVSQGNIRWSLNLELLIKESISYSVAADQDSRTFKFFHRHVEDCTTS